MLTPSDIRSLRAKLGWSQKEMADMLGLSPKTGADTVRSWETDEEFSRFRQISGPAELLMMAFLDGWRPNPHRTARMLETWPSSM